jgi:hypothetical protein
VLQQRPLRFPEQRFGGKLSFPRDDDHLFVNSIINQTVHDRHENLPFGIKRERIWITFSERTRKNGEIRCFSDGGDGTERA